MLPLFVGTLFTSGNGETLLAVGDSTMIYRGTFSLNITFVGYQYVLDLIFISELCCKFILFLEELYFECRNS